MSRKWRTASVMAASLALAGSALGGDEINRRGHGRGFGSVHSPVVSYTLDPYVGREAPGRIWVPAAYDVREREIVIPARYETIYEKVWAEPVYEWVTREVWVPARRRHRHLDLNVGKFSLHLNLGKGRKRGRRGHYETVRERVLVHAGHYDTVAREVLVRRERVEVVLETPSHLEVVTVDEGGAPVPGARLRIWRDSAVYHSASFGERRATTDAGGVPMQ